MRLGLGIGVNKHSLSSVEGVEEVLEPYGTPAVAYDLRYLYPTIYSGDVILVRRSSDSAELGFSPTEITDGTLTSWVGAGDGFVKTWYDQSGNSINASQTDTSRQPKIVESGTLVTESGLPSIKFDGSSDYFQAAYSDAGPARTIFSVFSKNSNTTTNGFWGLTASIGISLRQLTSGGSLKFRESSGSEITAFGVPGTYARKLITITNAASEEMHIDGNLEASGTLANGSATTMYVGAIPGIGVYLPGNYSTFIMYDSDQSANRAAIETNINSYYSIY